MQATTAGFKTTVAGNDVTVSYLVAVTLPITRTNMLPDPNFDHGIPGWAPGFGAAIVASGTHVMDGANALRVTWATMGTHGNLAFCQITTTKPASVYTLSGYVWNTAGNPAVQLAFVDVPSNTWTYGTPSATTGAWERISVTFTAASNVTDIVLINAAASTAGQQTWLDQLLVEESGSVLSYFSGDTAGATWTGTPGYSPSVLNVNPYPDVTLSVVSIDVDRQLTTDMPDGTRLISGYPTAAATVVLGGMVDRTDETKTAAWLFNPNSSTSPMYRLDASAAPVRIEAGVLTPAGVERVTVFTGTVDSIKVDGLAGTVTLECLDYRQKLRTSPVLPAVGAVMDFPYGGLVTAYPGLTAGWIIDTLLRANLIYQSPGPRTGCVFYSSMSGSAHPQLYHKPGGARLVAADAGIAGTDPMVFVPGNWSPQVCRDYLWGNIAIPPGAIQNGAGGGWLAEWWMNCTTPDASLDPLHGMYVAVATTVDYFLVQLVQSAPASTTWAFTSAGGVSHNITLSAAFHQFTVQINVLSSVSVMTTLYVDGVLVNTWTEANTPAPGPDNIVEGRSIYAVEAMQVTNELAGVPRAAFTPTAYLDESLNTLTATVDISGRDPWAVVQEIAQAEGAVAGFDELGVFRFINRANLNTAGAVRAITSGSSLATLTVEQGLSTVATHVTAPVNVLSFSTYQCVWQASEKIVILPKQTYTTVVDTGKPVISVATFCGEIASLGITPTNPVSGYRAAGHPDGTGTRWTNLVMTVQQLGPTSIAISVYNPNNGNACLVSPVGAGFPAVSNGKPSLAIGGEFIVSTGDAVDTGTAVSAAQTADSQWPPVAEGGAVTNPRGEILLALAANPWRQNLDPTQTFTDDLIADLYKPRPLWRNMAIVADPSLQLADRVTVVDPDGSLINDDAVIVGIHTTISLTDWSQTVDLRAVATPGAWILGQVGRSELAVTTYA